MNVIKLPVNRDLRRAVDAATFEAKAPQYRGEHVVLNGTEVTRTSVDVEDVVLRNNESCPCVGVCMNKYFGEDFTNCRDIHDDEDLPCFLRKQAD